MQKFIVVTGGTKGIGRAILDKFASNGFDVCTCARQQKELDKWRDETQARFSVKAYAKSADLSVRNEVSAFVDFVNSIGRPLDVLVNNAGYFKPGLVTEEQEGALESMINSNLYSAYHTCRGLVAGMKASKTGHIFNMCSIASKIAYPNGGSYAISKFAMLGLTKVLREELKSYGIRVTAVLPGATRTASWDGVDLPEERFMKVEDVADTVFAAYQLSGRAVVEEVLIRPLLGDI
jgi:short-subunit dehydrogenase